MSAGLAPVSSRVTSSLLVASPHSSRCPPGPQVTAAGAWLGPRLLHRGLDIEVLDPIRLIGCGQLPEEVGHLVLPEARQREVDVQGVSQVCEEASQEPLVPVAADAPTSRLGC